MKLFGWGKSQGPQPPIVRQQVKKTDPRNSSQAHDRGMQTRRSKTSSIRMQQGLFRDDDIEATRQNDEKLQDTTGDKIRFVFSQEHDGLLAIGTFALDQLAAIRDTRNHQSLTSDGFEACIDLMPSSDEEDHLPRTVKFSIPSGALPDEEKLVMEPAMKVMTLSKGNREPSVTGTAPVVLRRTTFDTAASPWLHRKSPIYVPLGHWTDSASPPVVLPKVNFDEQCYSSYFCGLFSSKNRAPSRAPRFDEKSRRIRTQKRIDPAAQEDHKRFAAKPKDPSVKSVRKPSLEKIAKLWRSSCIPSTARIAPERQPCSSRGSHGVQGAPSNEITGGDGFTAPRTQPLGHCDNRMRPPSWHPSYNSDMDVAEFRRRVALHKRNMRSNTPEERRGGLESSPEDGGHWIKTDSEYVVLEM